MSKIKMWDEIQLINPVWYIDATGSILINIPGQKNTLLYTIVCHDSKNKIIIPIGEFFSSSHTTTTITRYLIFIRDRFYSYSREKYKIAPIMVTDFSWALINSILHVFNNCTIYQYIKWTFEKTVVKKSNLADHEFPTRIYLCSTHFLKSFVRKIRKTSASVKQKKSIIFAFTLLQNATSIAEFSEYLLYVIQLFFSKTWSTSCKNAFGKIKAECLRRSLSKLKLPENEPEKAVNETNEKEFIFEYAPESVNLKQGSPYIQLFKTKIEKIKESCSSNSGEFENPFYFPLFLNYIEEQINILPLWTGIIISDWQTKNQSFKKFSRLSNNSVENWFGQLKNNYLKNTKVMPSEYCARLYKYLENQFFIYYEKDQKDGSQTSAAKQYLEELKKEIQLQKLKNVSEIKEKWKNKLVRNGVKSFYYSSIKDYGFLYDEEADYEEDESDFFEAFKERNFFNFF